MVDVKLSSLPEYQEFGRSLGEGRREDARRALERCLQRSDVRQRPDIRSFLLQALGDVLWDTGNEAAALASHEAGVEADPTSPLAGFRLAGFLLARAGRPAQALSVCEETRQKFGRPRTGGGELSQAKLEGMALALEARCLVTLGRESEATAVVGELSARGLFIVEHALEACEVLVNRKASREVARRYLEGLLGWVESSGEGLAGLQARLAAALSTR